MICPKCKKEIKDTSKVCGYCGNKIATVVNVEPKKVEVVKYVEEIPEKTDVVIKEPAKDAEIEALKAELDYIKKDQTSAPKCPWCGSTQIQALNQGFSAGKALGGAILFGGIGLLAGAAGMNKTKRVCLKCGRTI